MGVQRHLEWCGAGQDLVVLARERWADWAAADARLAVVEDPAELSGWTRSASREEADGVLLALARLGSPSGGDDLAAAGMLALLLLPGAKRVASQLARLSSSADELVASALWLHARTFPWRTGHKVAENILTNVRRQVTRELVQGVGETDDWRVWDRCVLVDPFEEAWAVLSGTVLEEGGQRRELFDLLAWAVHQGVLTRYDCHLLIDLAVEADRIASNRRGSLEGLTSGAEAVARKWGMSSRTVSRRASESVRAVRVARRLAVSA